MFKKLTHTLLAIALCSGITMAGTIVYTDGSTGRKALVKTTADGTQHLPNQVSAPCTAAAADLHAPAANTAAVVTYAATASVKHVITGIAYSYTGSGTLAGGNLKVEDVSGTTVFTMNIQDKKEGVLVFPRPLRAAAVNTALIVTLAAGGANVSGTVSVLNHWTE